MIALIGVGAGGNLPVDGTMFLEFIPGNKQYLLTFLSIWWAVGQVVASLIAVSPSLLWLEHRLTNQWVFIANYGCASRECFWISLNLRIIVSFRSRFFLDNPEV
jgi:MFS family permease